jgi:hypothetical protein
MDAAAIAKRLLDADASLWPSPNVAATRLGWLRLAADLENEATALVEWADQLERSRVVLLGMGGSSLGPEVLRAAIGSGALTVLDTTEPSTVAAVTDDLRDAVVIVSSKSGGTLEIQTLLARCWEVHPDASKYVAITDPGTELDTLATDREFGRVFRNDPNIGGRYSVMSYFGLVPAALLGYDVAALLAAARDVDAVGAVEAGIAMGEAALAGHVLEVDPFDEPNVAESKANTKRVLAELPLPTIETADADGVTAWLRDNTKPGDYVSLQAYMPYGDAFGLDQTRHGVRDALGGMPVTAGYGPRFLHSTGQLHKGGPDSVVAVQIVPRSPRRSLEIPGFDYDFGTLIDAQAIGDHQSLVEHGRRVLRVAADDFAEIN